MKLSEKRLNELCKEFAHVEPAHIKFEAGDYKTERGLLARLSKENEENEEEHSKPLPVHITLEVEWHKSSTWGSNPSVEMTWEDEEGHYFRDPVAGRASGCGYDKHSAAVAEALNKHCKNLLWAAMKKNFKDAPYGIHKYGGSFPSFEGGVGMSCYPKIFAWLGYKCTCIASGKTYDVWQIERKTLGLKSWKK